MAPNHETNFFRAFALGEVLLLHNKVVVGLVKDLDRKSIKPGFEKSQEKKTRKTLVNFIRYIYPSTQAVEITPGCFIRRDGQIITRPFINDHNGQPHRLTQDEIVPRALLDQATLVFNTYSPIKIRN
jgi:hypothetical protein